MNALLSIVLLLCGFIWVSPGSAAEATPASQAAWEKTLAAAKTEGRLNFYVGRYGSEPLLNEFRKEFPEIKLVTVNGAGNTLGTRIIAEMRAGNVLADLFSGGAPGTEARPARGRRASPRRGGRAAGAAAASPAARPRRRR